MHTVIARATQSTAGVEQTGQNLHHPLNTVCATLQEGTAFFPGSSLAGNGLLVSDGAVWQRQRQLTNPGFRKAAVETYAAVSHLLSDNKFAYGTCADVSAPLSTLCLLFSLTWRDKGMIGMHCCCLFAVNQKWVVTHLHPRYVYA